MNERDTFNENIVKTPKYRIDNSQNNINSNEENKTLEPIQTNEINHKVREGLSKTKIININDFIFRQYLEFYPSLIGLSCKDNVLYLQENGETIASETLTFDLRTLPGEAWNVNAKEFMEIIKINKSCKSLESFVNLLNQNGFNNINMPNTDDLENKVTNYMNLYFSAKDSFSELIEDNKILIGNLETLIATLPKETMLGTLINRKLDEYFEITKEIGDKKGKGMVLELKNKNVPTILPEETPAKSSRAAFINIAIILYGVLNIGIILAIGLMK